MNETASPEILDTTILGRIENVLRLRDAADPDTRRTTAISDLGLIRNMLAHTCAAGTPIPGEAEGPTEEEARILTLLGALIALEMTSLGTEEARRLRARATARRVADILTRHDEMNGAQIPAAPAQANADMDRTGVRPDPLEARTPAELVQTLRQYRMWAGNPSFRRMSRQAGGKAAASTMCTALRGNTLPRLPVMLAIVAACGGSDHDTQRFAAAWRRIRADRGPAGSARAFPNRRSADLSVTGQ